MVLSILVGRSFHRLHSQVSFSFLDFFSGSEVLGCRTRSKLLFLLVCLASFEVGLRSKFIGIILLLVVLSILVGRNFHRLHSQVSSSFLDFFSSSEVLVVYLGWVIELFFYFSFCFSLYFVSVISL